MNVESTRFAWRDDLEDEEVVELTRAHGGHPTPGWWDQIRPHSLGWVTACDPDGTLLGFANVAWGSRVRRGTLRISEPVAQRHAMRAL